MLGSTILHIFVTKILDEDGRPVYEFKDKSGLILLHRKQEVIVNEPLVVIAPMSAPINIGDGEENGNSQFQYVNYDTYYVYDVFGNLRYVLPPEASDKANQTGGIWTRNTDFIKQYAYIYDYDVRNQCISKKIPGAETFNYVYDRSGRLSFYQDGEQGKGGSDWNFIVYDILGRQVMEGRLLFRNSVSLSSLVSYMRDKVIIAEYTGDSNFYGYSNPLSSNSNISTITPLKINYYDDYHFRSLPGFEHPAFYYSPNYPGFEDVRYGNDMDRRAAKGCLTACMTAMLDNPQEKIASVFYYDKNGNIIQSSSSNHLSGHEISFTNYSFTNQPLWTASIHTSTIGINDHEMEQTYTFDYDSAGRPIKTWYKLDGHDRVLMSELSYDDLGRVSKKTIHNTEDISYDYNIRGWVKEISGNYFGQKLYYEDSPYLSAESSYSGNVSAYDWWLGNPSDKSSYLLYYDGMDRFKKAQFLRNGVSYNYYNEEVTGYSKNGNILGLKRHTVKSIPMRPYNTASLIDNLTLTYNGNQLQTVYDNVDSSVSSYGFYNSDNPSTKHYNYNANGSMISDTNREISKIEYNSLNLPRLMEFEEGHKITYSYDALGSKRRVVHTTVENIPTVAGERTKAGVMTSTTTDYAGGIVYEGGKVKYILTPEGYITPEKKFTVSGIVRTESNSTLAFDDSMIKYPDGDGGLIEKPAQNIPMRYHYFLKDYQGNNRCLIYCNEGSTTFTRSQLTHYYPFGMPWETSSGQEVQPYKREGKEYDQMYGLNMYDQGARKFGAAVPITMTIDPLAEKYYSISPYAQWGNNPVKYVDPTGMWIEYNDATGSYRYNNGQWERKQTSGNNIGEYIPYTPEVGSFLEGVLDGLNRLNKNSTGSYLLNFFANDIYTVTVTQGGCNQADITLTSNTIELNKHFMGSFIQTEIGLLRSPFWLDIGHELAHVQDVILNGLDQALNLWIYIPPKDGNSIYKAEIYATHMENQMRADAGLHLRTHYLDSRHGIYFYPSLIISNGVSLFYGTNYRIDSILRKLSQ